jgi:hypothetical protein
MMTIIQTAFCFRREGQEPIMGEVIQFVPKSERERMRLIREARAIYDSIFPSAGPADGGVAVPVKQVAGPFLSHGKDGIRRS